MWVSSFSSFDNSSVLTQSSVAVSELIIELVSTMLYPELSTSDSDSVFFVGYKGLMAFYEIRMKANIKRFHPEINGLKLMLLPQPDMVKKPKPTSALAS